MEEEKTGNKKENGKGRYTRRRRRRRRGAKLSGGQNAKGGIYRRLAFPPVTYYARIRREGIRGEGVAV